jgi:hypothetical protein
MGYQPPQILPSMSPLVNGGADFYLFIIAQHLIQRPEYESQPSSDVIILILSFCVQMLVSLRSASDNRNSYGLSRR